MASLRPCVSSLRLDRPDSGSNVIPRRARPDLAGPRPHHCDTADGCERAPHNLRSLGVHSVSSERDLSIGAVGS